MDHKQSEQQLENILNEIQGAKPAVSVDDDAVDAILASLGMETQRPIAPKPADAKPAAKQPTPPKAASSAQPKPASAAQEQPAPPPAPSHLQPPARIVDTPPLAAPVVKNETATLELPSIKQYSEAQALRIAQIERAAAEAALARASARQKNNPYNVPGVKARPEVLSVEVDDRFRAFFGKSVAQMEDAESEPEPAPTRKRKRSRKSNTLRTAIDRAVTDPEEFALTGEFDIPLQRKTDDARALPQEALPQPVTSATATTDTLNLPPLLDLTGNIDVAAHHKQSKQRAQAAQNPQQGRQDAQKPQPRASAISAPQPLRPKAQQPAAPVADKEDTALLNRFDLDEQNQPPVFEFENLPPQLDGDDFFEPQPQPAGTFRELTITMPLTDTLTDTLGLDPDAYGVPARDYEENEDYNHTSDAPAVQETLDRLCNSRGLRILLTGVLAALLGYLNLAPAVTWISLPSFLDPVLHPIYFLAANLVLLLAAALLCIRTLASGLAGLARRPSADTFAALAVIACTVQCIVSLAQAPAFSPEKTTMFAPLAALLLCFNTLGKWLQARAVRESFKLTSAGYDRAAAFLVPNMELSKMVCSGLGVPDPLLLVSRPTELVRGFMRQSFSSHLSDVYARKLSYIVVLCSIVSAVVSTLRGDISAGVSAFCATVCLASPLAATLLYAVPTLRLQRDAAVFGAVVPGPSAVQNLGLCNTVLLNSRDLFPASSVRLHGIKTFDKQRIDLAMLYAASILNERSDTLRDVFLNLIDGKKEVLYKVENLRDEPGYGYSGWIERHEVLVGNRELMRRHGISLPSRDYERPFTQNGARSIIYLSVNGRLFGMFVVSYQPCAEGQAVLDSLADSGICALIHSEDFNLNAQVVAATYNVSSSVVKVLSQPESDMLASQTEYMPESEGYMTHQGTCSSFVGGLRAAAHAARSEHIADSIATGEVIFTILICILLSFTLGLANLPLYAALLYQIAWCVITVLPALLRKMR